LSRWLPASLTLLAVLAAPAVRAEVRLEVSGQAREAGGLRLVRVEVANRGDRAATGLEVEGELRGAHRQAALLEPLAAGATRGVELAFPADVPRPGVHGLALHLRYTPEGAPAGASPSSQRAYLLLALGADPPPSVRLRVTDAVVTRQAEVAVHLESADGAPHRVRLKVLAPRGLSALEPEAPIEVPAGGTARVGLLVLASGPPPAAPARIVVLAAEVDGPLERTAAAAGRIDVHAPSPWLPRWRGRLLVAALVLLAAAVIVELWWFRYHPA
jgi:hypothetical protein